jgi:hypothetical protein
MLAKILRKLRTNNVLNFSKFQFKTNNAFYRKFLQKQNKIEEPLFSIFLYYYIIRIYIRLFYNFNNNEEKQKKILPQLQTFFWKRWILIFWILLLIPTWRPDVKKNTTPIFWITKKNIQIKPIQNFKNEPIKIKTITETALLNENAVKIFSKETSYETFIYINFIEYLEHFWPTFNKIIKILFFIIGCSIFGSFLFFLFFLSFTKIGIFLSYEWNIFSFFFKNTIFETYIKNLLYTQQIYSYTTHFITLFLLIFLNILFLLIFKNWIVTFTTKYFNIYIKKLSTDFILNLTKILNFCIYTFTIIPIYILICHMVSIYLQTLYFITLFQWGLPKHLHIYPQFFFWYNQNILTFFEFFRGIDITHQKWNKQENIIQRLERGAMPKRDIQNLVYQKWENTYRNQNVLRKIFNKIFFFFQNVYYKTFEPNKIYKNYTFKRKKNFGGINNFIFLKKNKPKIFWNPNWRSRRRIKYFRRVCYTSARVRYFKKENITHIWGKIPNIISISKIKKEIITDHNLNNFLHYYKKKNEMMKQRLRYALQTMVMHKRPMHRFSNYKKINKQNMSVFFKRIWNFEEKIIKKTKEFNEYQIAKNYNKKLNKFQNYTKPKHFDLIPNKLTWSRVAHDAERKFRTASHQKRILRITKRVQPRIFKILFGKNPKKFFKIKDNQSYAYNPLLERNLNPKYLNKLEKIRIAHRTAHWMLQRFKYQHLEFLEKSLDKQKFHFWIEIFKQKRTEGKFYLKKKTLEIYKKRNRNALRDLKYYSRHRPRKITPIKTTKLSGTKILSKDFAESNIEFDYIPRNVNKNNLNLKNNDNFIWLFNNKNFYQKNNNNIIINSKIKKFLNLLKYYYPNETQQKEWFYTKNTNQTHLNDNTFWLNQQQYKFKTKYRNESTRPYRQRIISIRKEKQTNLNILFYKTKFRYLENTQIFKNKYLILKTDLLQVIKNFEKSKKKIIQNMINFNFFFSCFLIFLSIFNKNFKIQYKWIQQSILNLILYYLKKNIYNYIKTHQINKYVIIYTKFQIIKKKCKNLLIKSIKLKMKILKYKNQKKWKLFLNIFKYFLYLNKLSSFLNFNTKIYLKNFWITLKKTNVQTIKNILVQKKIILFFKYDNKIKIKTFPKDLTVKNKTYHELKNLYKKYQKYY